MTDPADPIEPQGWRAMLRQAMIGCWRLATFEPSAADCFPPTRQAALRSFWAVALLMPLHVAGRVQDIARLRRLEAIPPSVPWWLILFAEAWLLILGICLGPVVIWEIARRFDRVPEYFRWLSAWNWTGLLIELGLTIALGIAMLLERVGIYNNQQAQLFMLIMACLAATYLWIGFHLLLRISAPAATGLTIAALIGMKLVSDLQMMLYAGYLPVP